MSLGQVWGACAPNGVATLDCILPLFRNVIAAALVFAGVVAVFMIIYSGIKLILSGGDAKQLEGARHTLTYAIIGLLIVLLSFAIVNLIGFITGTQDLLKNFTIKLP